MTSGGYNDSRNFSKTLQKNLPYFVVATIVAAVLVGDRYPNVPKILKSYTYVTVFWMLIPMMVSADMSAVVKVFVDLKLVVSAITLNFIITPPLGKSFATIFYHHQPVLLPVGYLLNMVTPCSSMVIAWTGFAGGSIEVATAVVALSLLLAVGFIPVWMWLLTHTWVNVPI